MKYNKFLFEWIAPILIGLYIGFTVLDLFEKYGGFGWVLLILECSGVLLYIIRAYYWEYKYVGKNGKD